MPSPGSMQVSHLLSYYWAVFLTRHGQTDNMMSGTQSEVPYSKSECEELLRFIETTRSVSTCAHVSLYLLTVLLLFY